MTISRNFAALAAMSTALVASSPSQATERAVGRYLPGLYAQPGAGIVPPFPGGYWAVANLFYHGKADVGIPIGNNVALDLETTTWTTALAGLFVPKLDLDLGNWTYAFQVVVPLTWNETTAQLLSLNRDDTLAGLGDIQVTPLLFGWHNAAGNTFFNAGLTVTAPTGVYERDEIAVVGLNYWTFSPAVAFTHIDVAHAVDFSVEAGVDVNTENEATDYYSGAMAHVDVTVTKSVTKQFSVGVFGGVLYQFEDDDSVFADAVGGFKGRSVSVGPLIKYNAKFNDTEVYFSLSWAPELYVKNRMQGDSVYFTASGKF